jgi:cell division protein FtsZ
MGILTVGIVTIPFLFEGVKKIDQALDGVEQMSQHVDALLVINDERLRDVYNDLSVMNAFGRADDTLSIAAKSIAEIITIRGKINLDFRDVETVVKDGGVAIMSTGYGSGENRLSKAISDALHSPLLNNNDVFNSKKILFNITYSAKNELMMEEMNELHDFMSKFSNEVETKWGLYEDDSLDDKVKFTVLATGFGIKDVPGMENIVVKRTIEEEKLIQQKEEEALQREGRRETYYGADRMGTGRRKRRPNIYLFNLEELDNDDVISVIDTTPTFSRAKAVVESLQNNTEADEVAAQDAETNSPASADNGNTIMF